MSSTQASVRDMFQALLRNTQHTVRHTSGQSFRLELKYVQSTPHLFHTLKLLKVLIGEGFSAGYCLELAFNNCRVNKSIKTSLHLKQNP